MTVVDRLALIAPGLAERLVAASPEASRGIARAAAFTALERVRLDEPRVTRAVCALQSNPSTGVDHGAERKGLSFLVEELDDAAFAAQDQLHEGTNSEADYDRAFGRARAAGALLAVFDPDPVEAAREALYEAYHALDAEVSVLHAVVDSRL